MNVDPWRREFDVAFPAVRDGAVLARRLRQQLSGQAFTKADRSPVTVADFAVQALVGDRLLRAFPDDPLVAEENAAVLRAPDGRAILQSVVESLTSVASDLASSKDHHRILDAIDRGEGAPGDRFWTLDPIDGTQGFVRGDQYVVALALIVQGRVEIGILGCPELTVPGAQRDAVGAIFVGVRNRGAFQSSLTGDTLTAVRVSSCHDPREARLLRSFEDAHIDLARLNRALERLKIQTSPTLMDSQAKHAVIAAGRADLMIRTPATPTFRDKNRDQAAGSLVIEEAGGRVTDLHGADLDFGAGRVLARNEGLIASNRHLHAAVLAAVR